MGMQEGTDLYLIPAIDMINHASNPAHRNSSLLKCVCAGCLCALLFLGWAGVLPHRVSLWNEVLARWRGRELHDGLRAKDCKSMVQKEDTGHGLNSAPQGFVLGVMCLPAGGIERNMMTRRPRFARAECKRRVQAEG